jgi:hypothetical protein
VSFDDDCRDKPERILHASAAIMTTEYNRFRASFYASHVISPS